PGDDGEQAKAILEQTGTAAVEAPGAAAVGEPRLPQQALTAPLRQGKRLSGFAPVNWASLPAWQGDDLAVVWSAFLRNCQAVLERGIKAGRNAAVVPAGPWKDVCVAAFKPGNGVDPARPQSVRDFLQTWLQPWQLMDKGKPAVNTVTGYYEPLVQASRKRGGDYQWPLYGVPDDMLTIDLASVYPELAGKRVRGKLDGRRVVPYDTRAEIDHPDRAPDALVWVDDPVD